MRSSRRRIAIAAPAALALALLGWVGLRTFGPRDDTPDAIDRAQSALSTPELIALASADVAQLGSALERSGAEQAGAVWELGRMLLQPVGLDGLLIERSASRVLVSVSAGADGPHLAAVLFGAFDAAALEAAVRASAGAGVRQAGDADERILYFARVDAESCAETPWGVALRPDRIVLENRAAIEPLLARLGGPPEPPHASHWYAQRPEHPLLALAFVPPPAVPAGIEQPLARALLRAGAQALPGMQRLSIRASRGGLLGALHVEAVLSARDADSATALEASWAALRKAERDDWRKIARAWADWSDELRLKRDGSQLIASAERGSDAIRALPELGAAWAILASRTPAASAPPPGAHTDQIEPWPVAFLEKHSLEGLPRYGVERSRAEPTDAIAGPFGLRLDRVTRAAPDAPLEIELLAVGPVIPNLAEPAESPRLWIERVAGAGDRDLLREERCGADRNSQPARLLRDPIARSVRAAKAVHLRADAGLSAVETIQGRIEFDLPLQTTRLHAESPQVGQTLQAAGATVEITSALPGSFSYRVRGDPRKVLAVRGLTPALLPLASPGAWDAELPFGGGRIGSRPYTGMLSRIEVVFALQLQPARYAFALGSARPGSDGEALQVESSQFIQYTPEQYQNEFGRFGGRTWRAERAPIAAATAGPFTVQLAEFGRGPELAPRLTVLAPDIPNLTYNATALELSLHEIDLADGSVLRPASPERGWRALLQPHHRYGREYLESSAQLGTGTARGSGEVTRIDGELLLRLPQNMQTLELPEVEPGRSAAAEGVAFTLTELGRDRFTLRMKGALERFFSAQAFGAGGQELSVEPEPIALASDTRSPDASSPAAGGPDRGGREAGSRDLRFRVHGQPRRLAIQIARDTTASRYPFRIEIGAGIPAAPEP